MKSEAPAADLFTIERKGDIIVITATPQLETVAEGLEEIAARLLFEPLKREVEPTVIVDLNLVNYFGSVFLGVLLRCWKIIESKSGTMVLTGVSSNARELLHVTSFDQLWPIYQDRREALEALSSD